MKKFFAIIMSVLMIACFMPTMAFATDELTQTASGNGVIVSNSKCTEDGATCTHVAEVEVGDTTMHYDNINAAMLAVAGLINPVEKQTEATIKLLKNVSGMTWSNNGIVGQRTENNDGDLTLFINNKYKKVTIDLNGKTAELREGCFIGVKNGTLEIKGTGTIREQAGAEWKAPIQVVGSTESTAESYSKLIVGKDVTLEGYCGIQVNTDGESYDGYGVDITVNGTLIGHADSKDSTDLGAGIEVKGELNKTEGNVPKITLGEGSKIKADGTGIYAGGYAEWTLNTTIDGATPNAMCIKSGKFTINGGEYYSSGDYKDKKALVAKLGSVDTGAAINIVNQKGYAGKIDVTINGGLFNSAEGYAIYQGTVDDAKSDAVLSIEDGKFIGKEGALLLTKIENKEVIKKGIFSSNPSEYMVKDKDKVLTRVDGTWYATKTDDEIITDRKKSAFDQGVKLAPLTDGSKKVSDTDLASEYTMEREGQKVTISVKPQLHTMTGKGEGKWVGIAVPVGKVNGGGNTSDATAMSYEFSNGVSVSNATIAENGIGDNYKIFVKKITIDGESYIGFYWDYDSVKVDWIKYRFEDTAQYNQVFVDVNATPAAVSLANNHKAGKDACAYDVEYAYGVATVNYCGLAEGTKAAVKVPVEYKAKEKEKDIDTYLYFKYNDADAWTLMDKTKQLDAEDGKYYEYCWIDLIDKNEVELQYKYGAIVEKNAEGLWVDPTTTGVYTLKVVANKVQGDATDNFQKHSYTNEVTTAPTTAATGVMTYTCERCGASYTKAIAKLVDQTKLTVTQPTSSVAKGSISTTESNLEYKLSTAENYTDLSKKVENLEPGTYYVRTKAGDNEVNGDYYVTVVINKYSSASGGGGGGYVAPSTDDTKKDDTATDTKTDEQIAAENAAKAVGITKALKLKARSVKTAKGNIKVTLTVDSDSIKAIEDLGYTVKYKFYRSTKKSASYKAALEKTGKAYTNTSGKRGTRYYYKARVMVYNAEGALVAKTALSQCKYACRVK